MLSSLQQVYKLIPHENFSQRTLEKMLTTNDLYTVKKYNGETLDDEMEFGYISKGGELSGSPSMTDVFKMINNFAKEIDALKSDSLKKDKEIAALKSDAKKKDKENITLRDNISFFTSCTLAKIATFQSDSKKEIDALKSDSLKQDKEIAALKSEIAALKSDAKKKDKEIATLQSELKKQGQEMKEIKEKLKIIYKANLFKEAFKHLSCMVVQVKHISEGELEKYKDTNKPKWISVLDYYFDSNLVIEIPVSLQELKKMWALYKVLRDLRNGICHQTGSPNVQLDIDAIEENFLKWYKERTITKKD